ncbi:MAG: dihydroorotate dehydrogenase electron transfer subunit [Pirellulaceae bacterium]
MSSPLHAAHYADNAVWRQVEIEANQPMARDTFRMRVRCPEIAQRVLPGQFVMVRLSHRDDPLIGRPLAVYDLLSTATGTWDGIDLIYHVKGKFTQRLACCQPRQTVDLWGPLGNGFPGLPCRHLIMVAGGVGQTPLLILAKEHLGICHYGEPPRVVPRVARVTLCYGARTRDLLAGVGDFEAQGVDVRLATDDGTWGHHGLVTELLENMLTADLENGPSPGALRMVCCGPEPMMRAAAQVARAHEVPCLVSLETPMACGIGICFSCVAKIRPRAGEDWDYKRTCVEGPVFDAESVCW